jgi:RNA polymerase sigma-70 factor (sigma-E family)
VKGLLEERVVSEQSREAFDEFVARRHVELVRFAYLLTGGDQATAEDLVQTVLLRLVAAGTWERVDHPEAYVRRGVVNEWTTQARALARRDWSGTVPERAVPDRSAEVADHHWVWAALSGLTDHQRVAVVLRYYADVPDAEIGVILGCTSSTVRSLVHRALPKVAAALEASASSVEEG